MNFDSAAVEQFKLATREKLRGVRCPQHHQPPRLHFQGVSLGEINISMRGCCEKLMELANARIGSPAAEAELRKPA